MWDIADSKFKVPYIKIIKLDNSRKVRALGSSLSKLPKCPKYPETGIIQPPDSLDTWVRPHLM